MNRSDNQSRDIGDLSLLSLKNYFYGTQKGVDKVFGFDVQKVCKLDGRPTKEDGREPQRHAKREENLYGRALWWYALTGERPR